MRLKCLRNVIVVTKGPGWFVKIADFGVSKRGQQDDTTLHTMQQGTFGFAAPEALRFSPESTYNFSVDTW
jgi:calcium/calmodulin-dependent protein kinase I